MGKRQSLILRLPQISPHPRRRPVFCRPGRVSTRRGSQVLCVSREGPPMGKTPLGEQWTLDSTPLSGWRYPTASSTSGVSIKMCKVYSHPGRANFPALRSQHERQPPSIQRAPATWFPTKCNADRAPCHTHHCCSVGPETPVPRENTPSFDP